MSIKLGVIMDPIGSINYKKDSTLAMLLAAQKRGWTLSYMEQADLYLSGGEAHGLMRSLQVQADAAQWYTLGNTKPTPLGDVDVILMRKDPPFDMDYIYTTYLLEMAEHADVLVVNKPQSLRDANEKLYTAWFPQCAPPTLVTCRAEFIRAFLAEHGDIILKPLDSMGGTSIFRLQQDDLNTGVIIETLTRHGQRQIMAQRFIPEIRDGDKRILLIDGEPVPYALARLPAPRQPRSRRTRSRCGPVETGLLDL